MQEHMEADFQEEALSRAESEMDIPDIASGPEHIADSQDVFHRTVIGKYGVSQPLGSCIIVP